MSVEPFWTPDQYSTPVYTRTLFRLSEVNFLLVPVVGMLCGSTISGVVVAAGYVLKEL